MEHQVFDNQFEVVGFVNDRLEVLLVQIAKNKHEPKVENKNERVEGQMVHRTSSKDETTRVSLRTPECILHTQIMWLHRDRIFGFYLLCGVAHV